MTKRIGILLLAILISTFAFGQISPLDKKDSISFLNVNITFKVIIVKAFSDTITQDYIMIDFPNSYYDKLSKTIKLTRGTDPIKISDSTFAIIRVAQWADESYRSGGTDRIVQFIKGPQLIDSLLILDSISKFGTVYLKIKNKKVNLEKNKVYKFETHKKVKTNEALFDYLTEYYIENVGRIVRRIEIEKKLMKNK